MPNALITPTVILNEGLRVLTNQSAFLGRINTQYSDEFAKSGGKVGQTINIRVPTQFTVRNGPVVNLQDVTEQTIPLTIQPEIGVDFTFSDFDLALTVDAFTERYIRPAMVTLGTAIDMRIAALYKKVASSTGTPGAMPTTQAGAQTLVLNAGAKLTSNSAPVGVRERMMAVGPYSEVGFLSQLNLGFNHQGLIGEQYREGSMGVALGFDWASSPNMPVHTVGPLGGTPVVAGANQGLINSGSTDNPAAQTTNLATSGWTAAAALRMRAGDVFTIAGVFEVNPVNKQATGSLRQFVAVNDVSSDGAGAATIVCSPAIVAGGAFQNVTARPANGAAITVLGTANASYEQNLGFTKDAFTFATVDMELPNGMDMAVRKTYQGVSMRFVRGYDITNNRRISRFDILAGYAALRPEWAVRVQGNQVA